MPRNVKSVRRVANTSGRQASDHNSSKLIIKDDVTPCQVTETAPCWICGGHPGLVHTECLGWRAGDLAHCTQVASFGEPDLRNGDAAWPHHIGERLCGCGRSHYFPHALMAEEVSIVESHGLRYAVTFVIERPRRTEAEAA